MHIVYLIHDFPYGGGLATGGAGNYVANIAQIMCRNGHKVSIITESSEEKFVNWNGMDIYYIQATKGFKNTGKQMSTAMKVMKNLFRSVAYNRKVQEIDKAQKVDIVQCVNTYGIGLLRLRKIPYVIRLSSYPSLWGGAERERFDFEACLKTRRLDEELHLLAVKNADCVIAPSRLIADITTKKIKKNIEVIESPVVIDEIEEISSKERELLGEKYFVTFGANINRKSIQMLAGVVDELLDKYPDMKYVVIGRDKLIRYKGDYCMASKVYDEKIIRNKERFVFMGEISDRKRLFSIVKGAVLCILPTRIDNLPNTVLEAMALGKVIVSSSGDRGTSVEQLISDGENGFLANIDDAEDLKKMVNIAMNLSLEARNKIGVEAMKRVEELTPEKVYCKMMKIYEGVIGHS